MSENISFFPSDRKLIEGPEGVFPEEGRHVLHAFFRVDRTAWEDLDPAERRLRKEAFLGLVTRISSRENTQLLTFSIVGPKADWGFMLLTDDLHFLDQTGKDLENGLGPGICLPAFGWLSMTERSEYTTTEEEYARTLTAEEGIAPGSREMEEKLAAFRVRMEKYLKDRLYPNLPDWPVVCFYPMSKRREVGQNWYALDFDVRKELMKGHARVGRKYSGRVLQLITGSTGLDSDEWGVTLFARTASSIKAIVYEMRFDPVSANYAEFGDFYIGLQMPAAALLGRLRL
jgi:chlorite dismutase